MQAQQVSVLCRGYMLLCFVAKDAAEVDEVRSIS